MHGEPSPVGLHNRTEVSDRTASQKHTTRAGDRIARVFLPFDSPA